jgi:glycosyltransferase involved in cell wall biosynthesis
MTISDPSGGGAEREFVNLVKFIPIDRYLIHVVLWRNESDWRPPSGVTLDVLGKTRAWHVPRTIGRLAHIIERFEPDVVYSQLHFVNTVTGLALKRASVSPGWLARFVNDPNFEFEPGLAIWTRRSLSRASDVLAPSTRAASALEDFLRLPKGSVRALDNVVDLSEISEKGLSFEPDRDTMFRFVSVGRLVKQKNHELLLEAFARLPKESRLWVLGAGELEQRLRKVARKLGVDSRIDWMGFVENPYPYIRSADCLVLSSDAEGLPNVLIEAMALGTAVISTRCDFGPDELIVHRRTGLLVEPGAVDELATAMNSVMKDSNEARIRSDAARKLIWERFAPTATVPNYLRAFERTVQ